MASTQCIDAGDGQVPLVHGFRTLLDDLATLTRNTVCFGGGKVLTVYATATPVQRRAFGLLGVESAVRVQCCINGLRRKAVKFGLEYSPGRILLDTVTAESLTREG
jgi:hypothetical protein